MIKIDVKKLALLGFSFTIISFFLNTILFIFFVTIILLLSYLYLLKNKNFQFFFTAIFSIKISFLLSAVKIIPQISQIVSAYWSEQKRFSMEVIKIDKLISLPIIELNSFPFKVGTVVSLLSLLLFILYLYENWQ